MQVVLSNGDLVVFHSGACSSSGEGDHCSYECVASFEQRNVTLARYWMTDPDGHSGVSFLLDLYNNIMCTYSYIVIKECTRVYFLQEWGWVGNGSKTEDCY